MKFKKNISPATWILISSASIVLVLSALYLVTAWLTQSEFHILPLIIADIGVFFISFFIYRFVLERFIYNRIRLIYKTIHTMKSPRGPRTGLNMNKDIISEMKDEVAEWEKKHRSELEEMKELENYRREFLGNVSHELKTPLFNIQGYILTLIEGAMKDPVINKEYLLRTEKNIERMIAVVEDLEVISRLETGELELDMTHVDIAALSRDVIELLEIKSKKKGIHVFFREDYARPVYVMADKERIRQVLINLIDNSIKYGIVNGKTKVSFFDMDENILVEITDNGIGIEPKDLPRIFERFFRVDKSRSREQGGSGLGLAIVKHILEAHDQTIHVRSTPKVGTTFAFTLKKV